MRLYLSSFGFGNQPQRLLDLVTDNMQAAVILNAYDYAPQQKRQARLHHEVTALQQLGFHTTELDLRAYFHNAHKQRDLARLVANYGLVWVRGGNTFVLRKAMYASGFDTILHEALARDALVYGGFSAGVVVLTPSLQGIELVDDPQAVPNGYDSTVLWNGLGLVSYALAPHYHSDHPESAAVDRLVQYYIDHHMLFKALRDGEVLIVREAHEEIVS